MNKRYLIIGCTGMLGEYLLRSITDGAVDGIKRDEMDITELLDVAEYFIRRDSYDVVINCAAITDTKMCETESYKSYGVNSIGVDNLAKVLSSHRETKFIHISTDYVFSEYSVNGKEFPVNNYGMHKLIGEKNIIYRYQEEKNDNFLILRTSWLFGNEICSKKTFVEKAVDSFLSSSKDGHDCSMVGDCYGKPTSCEMVRRFIVDAVDHDYKGLMDAEYLGEPISRYEYAKLILNEFTSTDFGKNFNEWTSILKETSSKLIPSAVRHPNLISNFENEPFQTWPTIGADEYKKQFGYIDFEFMKDELKKYIHRKFDNPIDNSTII